MRILLAHPGASFSTADVHDGLLRALERGKAYGAWPDLEVVRFALDSRIDVSQRALLGAWRHGAKARGVPKPTEMDVVYFASLGVLERALLGFLL